jgi:hypothetical protein
MNLLLIPCLFFLLLWCYVLFKNPHFFYGPPNTEEFKYSSSDTKKEGKIPKIIYTYWNDPENIPETVSKCIDSWKRYNPDYKIVIINSKNIKEFIPFDITKLKHATSQQKIADFLRICLLAQNGGIWLDSTIYLNHNLDWINEYQANEDSEYVGYYLDEFTTNKEFPVIENWFLACIPGSKFIQDWCNEFLHINDFDTIGEYIKSIEKITDFQAIDSTEYLTMHCCAQKILQNPPGGEKYKLSLLKAEYGPFLYNVYGGWFKIIAIPQYFLFDFLHTPVVKFRGPERTFIEIVGLNNFL